MYKHSNTSTECYSNDLYNPVGLSTISNELSKALNNIYSNRSTIINNTTTAQFNVTADIPINDEITNVEILVPNKVIKVTFSDNTFEKSVCDEVDNFDLSIGISICILKHLYGRTKYYKKVKDAIKLYTNNCKKLEEDKLKAEAYAAKRERIKNKKLAKKAKLEEELRANRIKEQAEAILLAQKLSQQQEN